MTEAVQTENQNQQAAPAAKNAGNKRQRPARATRQPPELSRPAMPMSIELGSVYAQRVFKSCFQRMSQASFSLGVILHIIGEREAVAATEEVVSDMMMTLKEDMDTKREQLLEIMKQNQIPDTLKYTKPMVCQFDATSPQIVDFMSLVKQMDELIRLLDTVWIGGIVANHKHVDECYVLQQRFIRLTGRVYGMEVKARNTARNRGMQDEVDRLAPESPDNDFDEEEEIAKAAKESGVEADAKGGENEMIA